MADTPQIPVQQNPIVAPDLSVAPGLIDNRPYQAPLPAVNMPFGDGSGGTATQPKTIAELFNSMKTPADQEHYNNPEFTPQPLTKRYSTWNPYIDNEEVAAEQQPWYKKWGNALVKTGATAIGTFAQSLMTVPDTVDAIKSGNFSNAYQSDFENGVDTWLKNLEDEFPNYYSKWETQHPFLSALPFSGGAANFWSDKLVKNLGFTIGAIGGAVFQDAAVGAVTDGLGEIPLIGTQIGKASLFINKLFSTETKLGEYLGATGEGRLTTLLKGATGAGADQKALFNLKKLAEVAATKKVTDAGRFAMNLYGASRTEGGFEARDGFNTVKADLIDQFRGTHFRDPNDEETADIEKYATASANVRFGANMALLALSDAIQFDNILKPFSSAKRGITGTLQKELETGAKIGLKEGSLDELEKKVALTRRGRVWDAIKPTIPNILAEGVYEEGGQYAAQVATQNYYERKYLHDKGMGYDKYVDQTPWDVGNTAMNVWHSVQDGLSGEFGTSEGWENIVLGGLTGVLTGGVERVYDKIKGHGDAALATTLKTLNSASLTGALPQMFGNTVKSLIEQKKMNDAAKNGDVFNYNNAQSKLFTNFILSGLQAGRFDVRMAQLDLLKDLTQENFEKQFQQKPTAENKKTVAAYVEGMQQVANRIKNNYEAIDEVFQNPYTLNKAPKTKEEAVESSKHFKFEEWKASLLEHTSDIDDTNKRLSAIGATVAQTHSALTVDLLKNLTRKSSLEDNVKEYEKKIGDLQKDIDGKISTGDIRKDDEKTITKLKEHIEAINGFLNSKDAKERDQNFMNMFNKLLHFKLNGEGLSEDIQIPRQNIPGLINYGVDANRLQARKNIAAKAYDILTSEKGFNKYFDKLDELEKLLPINAETGFPEREIDNLDTNNMQVPVKLKGGTEEVFQTNKSYTVDTGTAENPDIQTLKYTGVDADGKLTFVNDANEEVAFLPNEISSLGNFTKKIADGFKLGMTEIGTGSPISYEQLESSEDYQKDAAIFPLTGTDPVFERTTNADGSPIPYNNFHQRHQTFLLNLGSTDPNRFNQAVKGKLKILPVTEKTAKELGFPEDFAKNLTAQEPTIRLVYLSVGDTDTHLLDEKGNEVQKLDGSPVDPSKVIFTNLTDTNQEWNGKQRFTNKLDLDLALLKKWQTDFRNELLSKDAQSMPLYRFDVSRGIPNVKETSTRNSVVDVGLISEKDLNKLVITIPTQGDTTIAALLNDEGEGVGAISTGVNMPLGVPLLNWGGNLVYLNNRLLTSQEGNNIYDLLLNLAQKAQKSRSESGETILDRSILKYLSRVIYFSTPQEGKTPSANQVWLDGDGIHFGDQTFPFFEKNLVKAKQSILDFLAKTYHNVNNYELNRASKEPIEDRGFNELAIKDGEPTITKSHPSYAHYLLLGSSPILATNIIKPIGNEIPIIQKYPFLKVKAFDTTKFASEPKPVKSAPTVKGVANKQGKAYEKPKGKQKVSNVGDIRHAETENEDLVSGISDTPLTTQGIAKVQELTNELIDKGISNLITSPIQRAKQTAATIANTLGIKMVVKEGLKPWDVGSFTGVKEADFKEVEKWFVEHPDETEYKGPIDISKLPRTEHIKNALDIEESFFTDTEPILKVGESFNTFVKRFLETREDIEKTAEPGTFTITHSKNLKVWDAYKANDNKWDEKAAQLYLTEAKTPANAEIAATGETEAVQDTFTLPDGRMIMYNQIQDDSGNVVGIKVIAATNKQGKAVAAAKLPPEVLNLFTSTIAESFGLIPSLPSQITTPPVVKKEAPKKENKAKPTSDIEARRADIEKRQKEDLSVAKGIRDFDLQNQSKENAVKGYSLLEKASKIMGQTLGTVDMMNQAKLSTQLENLINSKYNAELAALEAKPVPTSNSALDKLKNHKGKPTDPQFRAVNVLPGNYKVADVAAEFAKARKMLPDWITFQQVTNMIRMTGGGLAWGAIQDNALYVYQNAEVGTVYHEAFEMVWQHFLEAKDQLDLFREFTGREGTFVDAQGNTINFADANFKQAKEQIAEEFRDYVMEGKLPTSPKQKNWFQKLVDFIKKIFLGKSHDINQLFKNINQGYYRNYPAAQEHFSNIEYREKRIKASESFIQDVISGMTADLFAREFEKDSAIVTQLEENPKTATKTVYGRLFNSMQYFFTSSDLDATETLQAIYGDKMDAAQSPEEQGQIAQEFEAVQAHWEFIKANWNEFVNRHKEFLKIFKVEFEINDNGEVGMTPEGNREDFENMKGRDSYNEEALTLNARNKASERTKLLFATLIKREFTQKSVAYTLNEIRKAQAEGNPLQKTRAMRETSQVKMPVLAEYAKVFNYVLHNTSNINGIYDIYKKLVEMSNDQRIKTNAVVDQLVNRLHFTHGFMNSTIDQAKVLLGLENALNKQKPSFVRQFVDENGKVHFRTSIVNSRVDQVVDGWIADIRKSDFVKTTKDGYFIFNKGVKDIKDPLQFLSAIGIDINKEDYESIKGNAKTKFDQSVNVVRSLVEENVGKKLQIISSKLLGIDSRLNDLAAVYVDKVIGDDTESMHFNLDGELTTNFVMPNFVSTLLNDANNSKNIGEFIAKNPQYNDIFHKDAQILKILFNEDGTRNKTQLEVTIVEGRESWNSNNRSAVNLTEAERLIYEINNNLGGIYYTLLPADAKTEWAVSLGNLIKANEYFDNTTKALAIEKFNNKMWEHLNTEVALAKDYKTNFRRQNINELGKTIEGRKKGESLRFFKDILPKDMVTQINGHLDDDFIPLPTQEEFNTAVQAWIKEKSEKTFTYLANQDIFSVSNQGNYRLNGLLEDFIRKNLDGKRNYFTREETANMIAFREMNYALANIEMHKIFFGDPAQYSDELKRIKSFLSNREWSHVDTVGTAEGFNRWANGLLNEGLEEGDPGYHQFSNILTADTVWDVTTKSAYYEKLVKILGEKLASKYEEMNEADAQTWQSPTSYRETLLKAGGRWTNAMERQFQWEMAYERQARVKRGDYKYSSKELDAKDAKLMLTEPDSNVFFYITKPIHSGIQVEEDTAIMSLDKTSSAPLFFRFVEGTQMEKMYLNMQKNGVDLRRVQSAHKVGIQNNAITQMYNEDGTINVEGMDKLEQEAIPFKYYGIQVDTSAKKEDQTEGSQLRKQATGNLMTDGVPIDFIESLKEHKEEAKRLWDSLSEANKIKESKLYRLVSEHEQVLSALSNKRLENLMSKLGIVEVEDESGTKTYEFKDKDGKDDRTRISDFLLQEVTRRELPDNIRDSIKINPDTGDFEVPLEALTNYQQVRNILWSTVEKTLIRPKVSGGMKTQLAYTGFEKSHRIFQSKDAKGNPIFVSDELKFYDVDSNGNTTKCEILLPYWFGKEVKAAILKTGKTFESDKEYKKHLLDYLNNTDDGKKLLSGIGFRIPTQQDNSIESFIVKDFLPEQMGDTVIFPPEITAKAGSDFDIDKMNMYLRNYTIGEGGYPISTPFENIDGNNEQQLRDYYEKYLKYKNEKYEQWHREKAGNNLIDNALGLTEEEEPPYVPTIDEFLHTSKGKSAYDINSVDALENRYYDILERIYKNPAKLKGLVTPNDASQLKGIAEKIGEMGDPNYEKTNQPYGRMLDSLWMMKERHKYIVGKSGVGIAAVAQSNLFVNQGAGMYMTVPKDFAWRFPVNTVKVGDNNYISLSAITNKSGQSISQILAQFIDGYVDISKGAWIIDLGANSQTAKDFLLMVKAGTDPYDVALFMNQPAIKMYTQERESRKSVSQINKDVKILNKNALRAKVRQKGKFALGTSMFTINKSKPERYSRADMESMIRKFGKGETLTKEEGVLQMAMLSDYQKIDALGWDLFKSVQGYNWDTQRNNDPNLVRRKENLEVAAGESAISSIDKVFNSSFIGTVRTNVKKLNEALKSLINTQSGKAGEILDTISKDLAQRRGLKVDDYRKVMLKAELSMLDYIIQTTAKAGGKNLNQWLSSILLSNGNSAARYLEALQKSGDIKLTNNPIIKNLRPNIDEREGKPSNIELVEKDYDSFTSNVWTDAFRELMDDQTVIKLDDDERNDQSVKQIFKRMVMASILQSGSKRSAISFQHLLPNEVYSSIVSDSLREIKADLDTFYDKDVVYRTNWEDNQLVPVLPPSLTEDVDEQGIPYWKRSYYGFNSTGFNNLLKAQGFTALPKIMRLDAFTWSDKKAIKTVDYIQDPENKKNKIKVVKLFRRVDLLDEEGDAVPLIASRPEEGEGGTFRVKYAVFQEINKWGDGSKMQEYYDDNVKSVVATNPYVDEISPDQIAFNIEKTGYDLNTAYDYANIVDPNTTAIQGEDGQEAPTDDDFIPNDESFTEQEDQPPVTKEEKDKGEAGKTVIGVDITDWKRASKKERFQIYTPEGKKEVQGYRVTLPQFPDFKSFVYKNENGGWYWSEEVSGKSMSAPATTIKQVMSDGIEHINDVSQDAKNADIFKEINLVLKDKDGGCK